VRQRAGVFESSIIYFFKASTFEREWLEQARRVASLGKPFKGSNVHWISDTKIGSTIGLFSQRLFATNSLT
jgi:hypothetical protein